MRFDPTNRLRKYSQHNKTSYTKFEKVTSFEFKHVDLIKINVEGGELGVVNGAINTIHKWKPVVLFENKRKQNENSHYQ